MAAKAAGYEIHVVSHFVGDEIKSRLSALGMICHNSSVAEQSMNPLFFLKSLFDIWRLLKRINPAALHCITIKPCLMGGLFARWSNKPIILSFVGLGRVFMEQKLHMKVIRWLTLHAYKTIFRNKKCLLAFEHEHDRNTLIALTGVSPAQTVVIDGAGINPAIYRYSIETLHPKPVVLFASRLLWSKGLGDLIEAKRRLQARGLEFDLNVAGISVADDPDGIPMAQIEQWHKASLINWLGKRSDVCNLIENSNVVALPSTYSEGIPRILLEAASVGRACIAYDVGGCQSLIIDDFSGSLVERSNIASLTDKLELLLVSPTKRVRMGVNGRQRVETKFASSLIINDTLKLYQRAIDAGGC